MGEGNVMYQKRGERELSIAKSNCQEPETAKRERRFARSPCVIMEATATNTGDPLKYILSDTHCAHFRTISYAAQRSKIYINLEASENIFEAPLL